MNRTKRLGTVLLSAVALTGGLTIVAAPAMANTCTPTVYLPTAPGDYTRACADAGTYDADPSSAGLGVHVAASFSLRLSGYTHICTGYYGAGVNIPFLPVPDTQIGSPSPC